MTQYDPTQFNDYARAYHQLNESDDFTWNLAQMYSFVKVLGDIKGKIALDVACGTGTYTRLLQEKEAKKIVGVDISQEVIRVSREIEEATPIGIEYHVFDVAQMPNLGRFNIVTAVGLFHYAKNCEHLQKMFDRIYDNLQENGRFLAYVAHPDYSLKRASLTKYGMTVLQEEQMPDQRRQLNVEVHVNPSIFVTMYLYERSVYEQASKQAGFKNLTWHSTEVPPEAMEKYGESYWSDLLSNPFSIMFTCDK